MADDANTVSKIFSRTSLGRFPMRHSSSPLIANKSMSTSETNRTFISLSPSLGYTIVDFNLQLRLRLVCSAPVSMSLSHIYSNIRVVTNADGTVRSTFCVCHPFQNQQRPALFHFICLILGNFSFSWVICIVFFSTGVVVIHNLFQAHILFALVLSKMSKVHGSC